MTREEEIKQAAEAYASQMCNLCLDKYCLKMGLTCPNIHESVITFTDGSEWADEHPNLKKNLWHDASKEPEDKSYILVRYNYMGDMEFKSYHIDYNLTLWQSLVNYYRIECWAYIDDILPKQPGNSEQLKGGKK